MKRPWGTGSVAREGDGYRARLPLSMGRRDVGWFADEDEAHATLTAALELEAERPSVRRTVNDVVADWLAARDVRENTRAADRGRWATYGERTLGTPAARGPLMPTATLTYRLPEEREEHAAALAGAGALAAIHAVLEHARQRLKYGDLGDEAAADESLRPPLAPGKGVAILIESVAQGRCGGERQMATITVTSETLDMVWDTRSGDVGLTRSEAHRVGDLIATRVRAEAERRGLDVEDVTVRASQSGGRTREDDVDASVYEAVLVGQVDAIRAEIAAIVAER